MATVDVTLDSGREIRAGSLFMEATHTRASRPVTRGDR
jgi:hypothetical protein